MAFNATRSEVLIPRKNYFALAPSFVRNKLLEKGVNETVAQPMADALQAIFNKFAVDERLNYEIIEKFLRGVGSGESTKIIAASDTVLGARTVDYQCDGTADEVQINQAIADLAPNGGRILLLEGTYTLANPITTTSGRINKSINFEGMGVATKLVGAAGKAILHIGHPDGVSQDDWHVSNIFFSGGSIGIETSIDASHIITNCRFNSQTSHGISMNDASTSLIFGNYFSGCAVSGITYVNNVGNVVVLNEFYSGGSTAQINTGNSTTQTIIANKFRNSTGTAILINSLTNDFLVEGNKIRDAANVGIEVATGSFDMRDGDIIGNRISVCGTSGIYFHTGAGAITDCNISSNHVQDCGQHGVFLSGNVVDCLVASNLITDCSTSAANTYDGIRVGGTANTIQSNKIKGPAHKYAINNVGAALNLAALNDCHNGYTTAHVNVGIGMVVNYDGSANNWNRA